MVKGAGNFDPVPDDTNLSRPAPGTNKDLDNMSKHSETNFNLRMMDEAQYKESIFGDISGITQINC